MNLAAIRATIELAKRNEAETAQLQRALALQIPLLHSAIKLPAQQPVAALLAFVTTYIDQVPNCLEAALAISGAARIDTHVKPLLQLAGDYFRRPEELVDVGLDELMYEAYLAHRLMEEVNDYYRASVGMPLVPVDLTVANLIGHHLIGEPFANELDEAVLFSVEQLVHRQPRADAPALQHSGNYPDARWQQERDRWPCLTRHLNVDLQLSGF